MSKFTGIDSSVNEIKEDLSDPSDNDQPHAQDSDSSTDRDPEKFSGDESSDSEGENQSEEMIRQMLQMRLNNGHMPVKKESPKILNELSVDGIVNFIKSGRAKKIITMAGAGISTSAGIPDFRSPGTGLYSNLQKYNLPDPQAIFEIGFFRENPEPFFQLAKELYPDEDKFKPTPSHYFIKLLHDKGLLLRHYTQNIDTLERLTGLPDEKLIEAHGTFHSAHCLDRSCKKKYSQQWMKDKLFVDEVTPTCDRCNSVVKPDIVFFGESLPDKFTDSVHSDFKQCDLLIVLGTSLAVQPFASLVDRVSSQCPRLLINLEICGTQEADYVSSLLGLKIGFDFESEEAYRDVALLGKTDESCINLAKLLGWEDDLKNLMKTADSKEVTSETSKKTTEEKEKN